MADQSGEIRRVQWREVFGFTRIFGSFRLSRQATKLLIALAAVVLTWVVGQVLDVAFRPVSGLYYDVSGTRAVAAPDGYWQNENFDAWQARAEQSVQDKLIRLAGDTLRASKPQKYTDAGKIRELVEADPGEVRDDLVDAYKERFQKALDDQRKAYEEASKDKKGDEAERARTAYLAGLRGINLAQIDNLRELEQTRPQGPFSVFVDFEGHYFRQAIDAVVHGNIVTGFNMIDNIRGQAGRIAGELPVGGRLSAAQTPGQDPLGLLACLALMAWGVAWLAAEHWLFALVFGLCLLAIWSLAGGAIARAAALQATRDEKADFRDCLRFGLKKWVHFFFSPIAPVAVFLLVGFLGAVLVSLLGNIPGFGGIWIGLLFWLALGAGLVMAVVVIGGAGGGLLMAPIIAVEGSDTFDAISRSYMFVFSRPWRAGFYGLVAAVYGAICYLFVRFFLFLVLLLTHKVIGAFMFAGGEKVIPDASKWELMWQEPTFENFHATPLPMGLEGGLGFVDWLGAWMVWAWVALVGALLTAWVISFVISASTYCYLLLRRVEDSTDLDEVYIEEPQEEEPAVESPAVETPAEPAPSQPSTTGESPSIAPPPSPPSEPPAEGESPKND